MGWIVFILPNFSENLQKLCLIQKNVVPLHREPAPRVSAHRWRRVADIIKKRLLALVLVS